MDSSDGEPSPKKTRTALENSAIDKVTNYARDRLSGALQEAITVKEEKDTESVSVESSPLKRTSAHLGPSGTFHSPSKSPGKPARRRKRRNDDRDSVFHHTFVMKLFDRSVDLAQFRENTPLYPVCRAWMRNEPMNTDLAPRPRSQTPEPLQEEEDGEDSKDEEARPDIYHLPAPSSYKQGLSPRLPAASPTKIEGAQLDIDQPDAPPSALLLSNHLVRWWGVRKSWKHAAGRNEERYAKSLALLQDMFDQ